MAKTPTGSASASSGGRLSPQLYLESLQAGIDERLEAPSVTHPSVHDSSPAGAGGSVVQECQSTEQAAAFVPLEQVFATWA